MRITARGAPRAPLLTAFKQVQLLNGREPSGELISDQYFYKLSRHSFPIFLKVQMQTASERKPLVPTWRKFPFMPRQGRFGSSTPEFLLSKRLSVCLLFPVPELRLHGSGLSS